MTERDLERKLRALDQIPAPDVWGRAAEASRLPGLPPSTEPSRRRRLAVAALAFVLAAGGVGLAVRAFNGPAVRTPHGPVGPHVPRGRPITVSALDSTGTLRCSAAFPSSTVVPGHPTGVRMTLQNATSRSVEVRLGVNGDYGALMIRDSSGQLLRNTYDSHIGFEGPFPMPTRLAPGESVSVGVDAAVLWPGPLRIAPYCVTSETPEIRLPEVSLQVSAPGPAPSLDQAIGRATEAAGPAFDDCMPSPGEPVTGAVSRPSGNGPPIAARCEAEVIPEPGFDVVVLAAIVPPDAAPVDLRPLAYEIAAVPDLRLSGSVAVNWWVYTVTPDSVTRVRQFSVSERCDGYELSAGGGIQDCLLPTEN